MTETTDKMEALRSLTGKCVLLEASVNPIEYLCTIGWHHRGQWFKDIQISHKNAADALDIAWKEWQKKCPKQ